VAIYNRVAQFVFTVDPGTPVASPEYLDPGLGSVVLHSVEVRIPVGHAGTTGLQLTSAGSTLIPYQGGSPWLQGDDQDLTFNLEIETGESLRFSGYNQGNWSHSWYLSLIYTPVSLLQPDITAVSLIPIV
jgi:hypothetical protein